MEDKSIKDFDRAIEQAMNENAVPPPFGAWNRIAAELDAPTVAPIAVRPFPIAAVGGFVAGALFLGGIVAGVLVYNGNQLNNITQPIAANTTTPKVSEITYNTSAVANQNDEIVVASKGSLNSAEALLPAQQQVLKVATIKPNAITTKAVDGKGKTALTNNNDVAVPVMKISSNAGAVNAPYYFPPVDITMDEQPQQNAEPAKAIAAKETTTKTPVTNTDTKKKVSSSSSSSSSFRGIKFKKKRSKFTYGSIIRAKKH